MWCVWSCASLQASECFPFDVLSASELHDLLSLPLPSLDLWATEPLQPVPKDAAQPNPQVPAEAPVKFEVEPAPCPPAPIVTEPVPASVHESPAPTVANPVSTRVAPSKPLSGLEGSDTDEYSVCSRRGTRTRTGVRRSSKKAIQPSPYANVIRISAMPRRVLLCCDTCDVRNMSRYSPGNIVHFRTKSGSHCAVLVHMGSC